MCCLPSLLPPAPNPHRLSECPSSDSQPPLAQPTPSPGTGLLDPGMGAPLFVRDCLRVRTLMLYVHAGDARLEGTITRETGTMCSACTLYRAPLVLYFISTTIHELAPLCPLYRPEG